MMKVDITDDNKFLCITEAEKIELDQIRLSFTKEIPNAFIIKKKSPHIDTSRCFVNNFGMMPIGLWKYLITVCKEFNLNLEFSEKVKKYLSSFNLSFEDFNNYIKETFGNAVNEDGTPFYPYDYQIKEAYLLLKYKNASGEISTSAGKTLIAFIIFKYLRDIVGMNNMLYIVPSVDLANQSLEKFEIYESYLENHTKWKGAVLHGGLRKKEIEAVSNCNILFGTFQSLNRKNKDFFDRYDMLYYDESHHSLAESSKKILNMCVNLEYKMAVTGTYPKDYGSLMIQSLFGPVIPPFTAHELIHDVKQATPIYVVFYKLNYATQKEKEDLFDMRLLAGTNDIQRARKNLTEEQLWVNKSYKRLKFICDLAINSKQNTLILFGDIKNGYGHDIVDYIKKNSDKDCYYVDGGVPSENREYYKKKMEDDINGNTVIVASVGTFSEGIDVKNLGLIMLVNTAKSDRIVRQMVGRGLRKCENKEKCVLFDFVDDLRFSRDPTGYKKENYMWKHYKSRKKIYIEHMFPVYEQEIILH